MERRAPHNLVTGTGVCGGCCTRLVDFGVQVGGTVILEGINLHIHCGELTVLVGPNGAGKTSLLRAMLGELPHSGELRYVQAGGDTPFREPHIGYVPQRLEVEPGAPVSVLDLFAAGTCRWPVWLGRSRHLRAQALEALSQVDATDLLDRRLGLLSGGQLQRVLLALALLPPPDLLLLDEPVSGVDTAGTERFYRLVSQLRRDFDLSIILVSHDLQEAADVADRMILLNRTIVCDGRPAEVLADARLQETFRLHLPRPGARGPEGIGGGD
jgi:zinc transport system ATP-binding protein